MTLRPAERCSHAPASRARLLQATRRNRNLVRFYRLTPPPPPPPPPSPTPHPRPPGGNPSCPPKNQPPRPPHPPPPQPRGEHPLRPRRPFKISVSLYRCRCCIDQERCEPAARRYEVGRRGLNRTRISCGYSGPAADDQYRGYVAKPKRADVIHGELIAQGP